MFTEQVDTSLHSTQNSIIFKEMASRDFLNSGVFYPTSLLALIHILKGTVLD
jgi:hypothetical protein